MRVNIYAEELTDRIEIVSKKIDGQVYTGLRFYLELPATVDGVQYSGPFMHRPGDDDSSAVTFWGKARLVGLLGKAVSMLIEHYRDQAVKLAKKERMVYGAKGEWAVDPEGGCEDA